MKIEFTGVIASCETRFASDAGSAYVTHLDARWIMTVDIESTDHAAPWRARDRVAFMIHSPVMLLCVDAERATGLRFQFSIMRAETDTKMRWSEFSAGR